MKKSIIASIIAAAVSAPSFASENVDVTGEDQRRFSAEQHDGYVTITNEHTGFTADATVSYSQSNGAVLVVSHENGSTQTFPLGERDTRFSLEKNDGYVTITNEHTGFSADATINYTSGNGLVLVVSHENGLTQVFPIDRPEFDSPVDPSNPIEIDPENPIFIEVDPGMPEFGGDENLVMNPGYDDGLEVSQPIAPMPPQDSEGWNPEGEDGQGIIGSGLIEVEYGEDNQRMWVVRDEDGGISMNYVIVEQHDDNTYTITRNNEDSTATVNKGNSTLAITSDSHEGTLSVTKYDGQVYVTAINADGDMKSQVFDGEKWNPIEVTDPELSPEHPVAPANPDLDSWSVEKHEIADATQVTFSSDDGRVMNITMQDGSISYVKVDADGSIVDAGKRDPKSIDRSKLNNIKAKAQSRLK
ncbi:RICIN domain-containing protein [Vibrio breoganii]|uniref:RICIN domain-containing protein n=1 Tax=Vibrio breoganii TaxID=553239 RepID=UPI0010BD8A7A|nr:RICIN domain-containing protein [Vibrio breoganii]TKG24271.1 RICIN domain-containing protein [Vibrio breoganii]